ncbi:hypothetical protein [Pseudalkalibacillus salsuginis]|uniref:hypothetical protein n=1 Tax=Pseudalkalibacillus salsuginis TaxID=2910972 RepID=UPI001F214ACB|nr:hypothetical protein [Pseudalkalibacillus salsuginis]MCF6409433.1 hypothetical protein [Pseudalkalibacillus salsuginis]
MKKIDLKTKRILLTFHLLFSGIMLGSTVVFLILSIAAAASNNQQVLMASYKTMNLLSKTSIRASTIGTVVTGIFLSALTQWGFLRYYWIIAKEVLTIFCIGIGMVGIYIWSLNGLTMVESDATFNQEFIINQTSLFVGIIMQIIFLLTMFFLSVFKPWGKRKARKKVEV